MLQGKINNGKFIIFFFSVRLNTYGVSNNEVKALQIQGAQLDLFQSVHVSVIKV
jgi:hypothetical protein